MSARLEHELEQLTKTYPGVVVRHSPQGDALIELPDFSLPEGWSKTTSRIFFHISSSYPESKPDCFYADPDLRLASGEMPTNAQVQSIPHLDQGGLWFSWHVDRWSPGKDDLVKFVGVISKRFEKGA